jgi:hypothetical protein
MRASLTQSYSLWNVQLARTTFTAGSRLSDDIFVNAFDGAAWAGPKEFHVNVLAGLIAPTTVLDFHVI